MRKLIIHSCCLILFYSCAAQKKGTVNAVPSNLLNDTIFNGAHIGISIYDADEKKSVYSYQSDKYFVPASNVKIITCYAAMKYLKHILPGIRYYENDTAVYLVPTGDPSLLHRDFPNQPVIQFLQKQKKKIYITDQNFKDHELGKGWSWDDYNDDYMAERNAMPVYGNTLKWVQEKIRSNSIDTDESISVYSDPEVNWKVGFENDPLKKTFRVQRDRMANIFRITEGTEAYKEAYVPFITNGLGAALELLPDTIGKPVGIANNFLLSVPDQKVIWSQPTDSLLRPMMYRSDNFFAEQLLLMVAEGKTGVMDAGLVIDSIMKNDLADLPQKPVWVDGSGMSRYNLFTPDDFVAVLGKMKAEFGMDRLKAIFPTGDSGTLKNYYVADNGYIYAKTGSMTGVLALSGFLYTRKNKLLIFSVLINNFTGSSSAARRAVERMLEGKR